MTDDRLSDDLLAALDSDGEIALTPDQVRELIAYEARQLGMTFEDARLAHFGGTLAITALGCDVDMLFRLLEMAEVSR